MSKSKFKLKKYLKSTDRVLISLCAITSIYSCILLFSLGINDKIAMSVFSKQAIFSALGLIIAIVVSKLDYEFMAKMWKLHMPVALTLTLLTFTSLGVQRAEYIDDRAWLYVPFIGTFQPSELLKLSFILTFSFHLSLVSKSINKLKTLIPLCIHGAIPVLLIHLQGDDGTAMIFAIIFALMIFKAGLSYKYILSAVGAVAVLAPLMWMFVLSEHQKSRFLAVYSPQNSSKSILWQQYIGKIAIGSGGIAGKGFTSDTFQPVPEEHNDFIFSFLGESMGFLGAIVMLALIIFICLRIVYVIRIADDELGENICVGVFSMIFAQSVINIGMNLSLIPVIGITLPLMSAGGTSVIATYISIGFVLSVYNRARGNMFLD